MAFEIITSLVQPIIDYGIKPIVHQLGYLICYNRNLASLEEEFHKLENEQVGVRRRVDAATNSMEEPLPNVLDWLVNVDKVKDDAGLILQNHVEKVKDDAGLILQDHVEKVKDDAGLILQNQVKANQRCYKWLMCPNLLSRYKVSRRASKMKTDIIALANEAKSFGLVATPAPPDLVATPAPLPDAEAKFGGDVEELESRRRIFEDVMEALKDDNVRMIGVYGMGGIGKTTLAKQVAVEAEGRNLFSKTAMVVVSQNPNVSKIQQDIADHLGLKFDNENVQVRRGKLYERLSQNNRVLLIFDDLWERLELADVIGIPSNRSCKIILTSRKEDVCTNMLTGAHQKFEIGLLSSEDGLRLFKKEIDAPINSREQLDVAKEIVEKYCQGLPLAITTVARALKGQSNDSWKLALRHFEKSTPEKIEGMSKHVYSVLEYSFTSLEPEEKLCFLICRLFEEDTDIRIEDVMRYGMGLGMLPDIDGIEDANITVRDLVKRLKARGLLLEGKDDKSVRMHDVFRDLARLVASAGQHGHQFLLKEGKSVNALPDISKLNDYTAISLLKTGITKLPEIADCPKPEVFKFEGRGDWLSNRPTLEIPESFFAKMTELKVLVIKRVHIRSLPQSIMSLKKLQTLCLEWCLLGENISFIGELKDLKILSMRGCLYIKELPKEFGQLTQLMILDLTGCQRLRVIPSNLLSRLTRLECLYLPNRFFERGEGSNAAMEELNCLSNLTTLEMTTSVFPEDLLLQKVMTFRIVITSSVLDLYEKGFYVDLYEELFVTEKGLLINKFELGDSDLPGGLKTLVERAESLVLDECRNVLKSALGCLKRNGFANLREFFVREKEEVKEVEEEIELGLCGCSELREVYVYGVSGLTNLWKKSASYAFLGNLKKVCVSCLHKLKSMFPQDASIHLVQLEKLHVEYCGSLEEIFEEGKEIVLSSLKKLWFKGLPLLRSFGSDRSSSESMLRTPLLFDQKVKLPALKSLIVKECNGLKYMFSASMINKRFNHLKELEIVDCLTLDEVVVEEENAEQGGPIVEFSCVEEENAEQGGPTVEFSCVENLTLGKLPNLRSFCSKDYTFIWPSLKKVSLRDCPNMQTFCSGILLTPKLVNIIIDGKKEDQINLNSAIQKSFKRKSKGNDIEAKS